MGGLFRVGAGSSVVSRQASQSRRQCRIRDRVVRWSGQNPPMTIRAFTSGELEQVCRVVAEAMTGGQLGGLLSDAGIADESGESTKWKRLSDCLGSRQRRDGDADAVVRFVGLALAPVRFSDDPPAFKRHRTAVNRPLAMVGLEVQEDGQITAITPVRTLRDAERRAIDLRGALEERGVHSDVLAACRAELLEDNYFHAVLEATKSLAEKIRRLTGLGGDGAPLADAAFGRGGTGTPPLAFNRLDTETQISEHSGLHNIIKGIFGAFRNPTAHAPRHSWLITKADALDLLQMISLLHRRLDAAHVTPLAPSYQAGRGST